MKKMILTTLVVLMGSSAFADQCAFVSKAQAAMAVRALLSAQRIQSLCEPCGETSATELDPDSVEMKKSGYENSYQVSLDDQGIDLAYTYVNGTNLAKVVGCTAEGVSPTIE